MRFVWVLCHGLLDGGVALVLGSGMEAENGGRVRYVRSRLWVAVLQMG